MILNILYLFYLLNFSNSSTGVVKYYNESKGFGYIIDSKTNTNLFVYEEDLIDEIKPKDKVSYQIKDTRKGLSAINVRLKQ